MTGEPVADGGLFKRARAWLRADPDPATRAELSALLDAADADPAARTELEQRFCADLEFGTAGLRGRLSAGPNRMNRVTVIRAAAGVCGFVRERHPGTPRLVVGFDARHGSRQFSADTAAVASAAGIEVLLFEDPVPTPVLAFAVRQAGCVAGVMVTASHNPAPDNGFKVYLDDGSQLVQPHDAAIAERMRRIGDVRGVERAGSGWRPVGAALIEEYLQAVTAHAEATRPGAGTRPRIVLTPMHGVGGDVAAEALRRNGFDDVHLVAEQAAPDPGFPTVAFPNPEEPGALDLAFALAGRIRADLVLALDPDADRCAVAAPLPDGRWRAFSGDQIGSLLGDFIAERRPGPHVFASSIVSGDQLAAVAAAHGARHVRTLTGFKWIARVPGLTFGYEEAIGYCVAPRLVADKDGISTAVLIAQMASEFKAGGATLWDALTLLDERVGCYRTAQISIRTAAEARDRLLADLVADPPATLAGSPVTEVADLSAGGDLPPTPGLLLATGDGVQLIVRPSGTEPKLKCYLQVRGDDPDRMRLLAEQTRQRLTERT